MNDETPRDGARPPHPPADPVSREGADVRAPAAGDPDAALRRLASMGASGAVGSSAPEEDPSPLPPTPAVDPFTAAPRTAPRSTGGAVRVSRVRLPAVSRSDRLVARIAAPVVFLIAVIALLGIVVDSGVLSADEIAPTPTPTVTRTGAATKKYVVRQGDSLSSIAARFDTTTTRLKELNPDLSGTTVVVGQKLRVPVQ